MLMDNRSINLPVDSASTSKEICQLIANKINLKDSFGFSIYVALYAKVHVYRRIQILSSEMGSWYAESILWQSERPE